MRHFASTYRVTRFAFAALAGFLIQPGLVSALALGNMALQSSLGQPLRVVIPVALSDGEILNTSCLKLVRVVRDPVDGTPQLMTGRVSVERTAANTRLIVTTLRPVDEPALRFSLQAGCGDSMRRDYVLLLDPQGTESSTMVASADLDEFKNYAGAQHPTAALRGAQRGATSTQSSPPVSAPAPTTFKPLYSDPPVAVAQTQKAAPAAPMAELTVTPREPVALITILPSSGFIAEAAAASLTPMSIARSNTTAAPAPTAMLRTRDQVPEETLWTQTWPYAAVLLSIGAIALTAFVKRPLIVAPAWSASVNNFSKSPMQGSAAANTFADFGAMSDEAPTAQRQITRQRTIEVPIHEANLDALLEMPDVEVDAIDEHAIRKAWATLANESAADIGTDSILEAIEAAERDMRISPPQPPQAAMDNALDDDLLRNPKPRH
jgi:hypothetical protein